MIFWNYLVAYKKSVLYVPIIYYSNIGKYFYLFMQFFIYIQFLQIAGQSNLLRILKEAYNNNTGKDSWYQVPIFFIQDIQNQNWEWKFWITCKGNCHISCLFLLLTVDREGESLMSERSRFQDWGAWENIVYRHILASFLGFLPNFEFAINWQLEFLNFMSHFYNFFLFFIFWCFVDEH